jgi:serine/threonine protein kinase
MDVEEEARAGEHPSASGCVSGLMERPGTRIGCYKLLKQLGEGGMGMVYLAEQEQLIRRRVALKIIKPGMDSKRVLARFEAERQALALLDHPNIAQVYDAGTAESGRPYFVMEYVKGTPITEFCDRHTLSIEQRLRLFQQVCQAVHHAHQKGIIHRDIKPSNILVTSENDQVIPKIIDFGVAKAVVQPLTERTLITEESQLLGTPEYMSPEQVEFANEDIDTRSDIYSLGVLLYELLTGALPFDSETLRTGGVEHIRKVIRETDPKTPSTRLTKLGEEAAAIAQNRQMEIQTLKKHLRKELEWIPLKAMRKERSQRYRSASELSDDIDNFLKGAPLMAGPLTAGYRLKKFIRRHKALVGGVTAVLIVLITGSVISTYFALGQARARSEVQLIADFLENDVLGSASKARIGEATVSYILDAASVSLEDKFKNKPLIEASIREKLAWIYRDIGEANKSEQQLLYASRIYRKHCDEEHPNTWRVMSTLGWIYEDQGRYREMKALCSELGFTFATAVANYHLGKYQDAALFFEEYCRGTNRSLHHFSSCNLARVYAAQGRYEEAEKLFVETLAEWPGTSSSWEHVYSSALADMYREQGRFDQAEQLLIKTSETQRLESGTGHLHTLMSIYNLTRLYIDRERYKEAEALFNEALPIARQRLRKKHPLMLRFVNAYAVLHTKKNQYDQAETFFDEALKGRQRELGDDHLDTLETKNDLAMLYKEQACYDEAERLLLEAIEGRRLILGDTHPHTLESLNNLIDLYETQGKQEEADKWRAKLPKD